MSAEIEKQLSELNARVSRVGDAPAEDQTQAVEDLHGGVADLCRQLGALPRDQASTYLPQLEALSAEIAKLDGAMRRRLDEISGELRQHGTRQHAVRAYGRGGPEGGPRR